MDYKEFERYEKGRSLFAEIEYFEELIQKLEEKPYVNCIQISCAEKESPYSKLEISEAKQVLNDIRLFSIKQCKKYLGKLETEFKEL